MLGETLIERFKAFYFDYRRTSDADDSFELARSALAYHTILEAGELAEDGDLEAVRDLLRQFLEIHGSTFGSNDSVLERLEKEFSKSVLH